MSLFLGTGSESKKCWQVILDSEITHVFQFVGRTSLPLATSEAALLPFGVDLKIIPHSAMPDPSKENPWTANEIDKMTELAKEVKDLLDSGKRVMLVCNAGMNRSPTLAAMAARMRSWETGEEIRVQYALGNLDVALMMMPMDSTLVDFVNIFDETDEAARSLKLAAVRSAGIKGEPRPKRKRS